MVSLFFSHCFICSRVAFSGGFWLRNLVTQRFRLVDIPVQLGMGFQLVHVLGEPVFEYFQFLLVNAGGLTHQFEAYFVFHPPCLADALFQFVHGDELIRIVGLHLDMLRLAQEDHHLRVEIVDSGGGEGVGVQLHLPDE